MGSMAKLPKIRNVVKKSENEALWMIFPKEQPNWKLLERFLDGSRTLYWCSFGKLSFRLEVRNVFSSVLREEM